MGLEGDTGKGRPVPGPGQGQRGRANGNGEGKVRDSPTDSPRTGAQAVGQGSRDRVASARTKGTRPGGRDQVEMAREGGTRAKGAKGYLGLSAT